MPMQTSSPQNIANNLGNGLAVFLQADGNLYLKDTRGNVALVSDYLSGGGGTNIYNSDGTLTANRALSLNDLNLNFVDSLGNNVFSSTGNPLSGNSQTTIITSNNSGNGGSQSKTMHLANNGVVVHDSGSSYGADAVVANALHVANSSGASNSITSLVGTLDKVQLSQQANAFGTIGSLTASDTEANKSQVLASTSKSGGNNKASLVSLSQNTEYQAITSFETSTTNDAIAYMSVIDLVNDHTAGIRLETDDAVSNLNLFGDTMNITLLNPPTAGQVLSSSDTIGTLEWIDAGGNIYTTNGTIPDATNRTLEIGSGSSLDISNVFGAGFYMDDNSSSLSYQGANIYFDTNGFSLSNGGTSIVSDSSNLTLSRNGKSITYDSTSINIASNGSCYVDLDDSAGLTVYRNGKDVYIGNSGITISSSGNNFIDLDDSLGLEINRNGKSIILDDTNISFNGGDIQFDQYGSGSITGTAVYSLSVDASGNVIETALATGNVTKVGTPVDGQLGVWTGDGTLEGDVKLTFDTSINNLVIGVTDSDFGYLTLNHGAGGQATIDLFTDKQLVGTATYDYWRISPNFSGTGNFTIQADSTFAFTIDQTNLNILAPASTIANITSGADSILVTKGFVERQYTVATLPVGAVGMRAIVTDAMVNNYNIAPTGGGSIIAPVYFGSGGWRIG